MLRAPTPATLHRLLAVASWVLVVCGLFAMHGLGGHGTGSHDAMGVQAASTAASPAGAAHLDRHLAQPADLLARPGGASYSRDQGSGGDGMSGLAMLCVVILAAALTVFALVLRRHLRRRPLCSIPRSFVDLVVAGRDRDPPDLLRLAVMRR